PSCGSYWQKHLADGLLLLPIACLPSPISLLQPEIPSCTSLSVIVPSKTPPSRILTDPLVSTFFILPQRCLFKEPLRDQPSNNFTIFYHPYISSILSQKAFCNKLVSLFFCCLLFCFHCDIIMT